MVLISLSIELETSYKRLKKKKNLYSEQSQVDILVSFYIHLHVYISIYN